jgi:hypothetical protein
MGGSGKDGGGAADDAEEEEEGDDEEIIDLVPPPPPPQIQSPRPLPRPKREPLAKPGVMTQEEHEERSELGDWMKIHEKWRNKFSLNPELVPTATPYHNKHDFEEAAHRKIDEIPGLRRLAQGESADPEAVAIYHAELLKAFNHIEQLKSQLYPYLKTGQILAAHGIPDLPYDVARAVGASIFPCSHTYWLQTGDGLQNMTVAGSGAFTYHDEVRDKFLIAACCRSGKRSLDVMGGGGDKNFPNDPSVISVSTALKDTMKKHPDKNWVAGFSAKMCVAALKQHTALTGKTFTPTSPAIASVTVDGTHVEGSLGYDAQKNDAFIGDVNTGFPSEAASRLVMLELHFKTLRGILWPVANERHLDLVVGQEDITVLLEMCNSKIPLLVERHSKLLAKYEHFHSMYMKKTSGAGAWGQQKTQLTKAEGNADAASAALSKCQKMKSKLELIQFVDRVVADEFMTTVKLVFIQLRWMAVEYFVALLQFNNGLTIFSIARLFIDASFKNSELKRILAEIVQQVTDATDGCVKVALVAADGKHRSLQENSLQGLARQASLTAKQRVPSVSSTFVSQARRIVAMTTLVLGSTSRPTKGEPPVYRGYAVPLRTQQQTEQIELPLGSSLIGRDVWVTSKDKTRTIARIESVVYKSKAKVLVSVRLPSGVCQTMSVDDAAGKLQAKGAAELPTAPGFDEDLLVFETTPEIPVADEPEENSAPMSSLLYGGKAAASGHVVGDAEFNNSISEIHAAFPAPMITYQPLVPPGTTTFEGRNQVPYHLMPFGFRDGKQLEVAVTLGSWRRGARRFLAISVSKPKLLQRNVVALDALEPNELTQMLLAENPLEVTTGVPTTEQFTRLELLLRRRQSVVALSFGRSFLNRCNSDLPSSDLFLFSSQAINVISAFLVDRPMQCLQLMDINSIPSGFSQWSPPLSSSDTNTVTQQAIFDELRAASQDPRFIIGPNKDGTIVTIDPPHAYQNFMTHFLWHSHKVKPKKKVVGTSGGGSGAAAAAPVVGVGVGVAAAAAAAAPVAAASAAAAAAAATVASSPHAETVLETDNDNWVACDSCSKWRKLPPGIKFGEDEEFACVMLEDPTFNSCDADEEETGDGDVAGEENKATEDEDEDDEFDDDDEEEDEEEETEEENGAMMDDHEDEFDLTRRIVIGVTSLTHDLDRGGEPGNFLSIANVSAAVETLGIPRLKNTVACAYDKQSQAVTLAFLCCTKLWVALKERGHFRDAVVLKYLGRALQAWNRPGLTSTARTQAMFLASLVVRLAVGRSMFDVRFLGSRSGLGFPVHQLLDIINMADIRIQMMELMPETEEPGFQGNPETMMTTKLNESHFSTIASDQGGTKPSPAALIGRVHRLEVVGSLIANLERLFNVRISKGKWKVDCNHTAGYNNGSDMSWNQDLSRWMLGLIARALRAMKNKTGPRRQSKMDGGTA